MCLSENMRKLLKSSNKLFSLVLFRNFTNKSSDPTWFKSGYAGMRIKATNYFKEIFNFLITCLLGNTDEAIKNVLTAEMSKRLNFISPYPFQGFLNAVFERLKQFLECCEYLCLSPSSTSNPNLLLSINKHRYWWQIITDDLVVTEKSL